MSHAARVTLIVPSLRSDEPLRQLLRIMIRAHNGTEENNERNERELNVLFTRGLCDAVPFAQQIHYVRYVYVTSQEQKIPPTDRVKVLNVYVRSAGPKGPVKKGSTMKN